MISYRLRPFCRYQISLTLCVTRGRPVCDYFPAGKLIKTI